MHAATFIAITCLIEILGMSGFATFPTLIPELSSEWMLSDTQSGWISGIYFGGYVIAVAVLTALTDRMSPKRVYVFSMAISFVGALGFAMFASDVWSASFWRLLQGIGLAGTYMPGLRILIDQLPDRLHSRATAFYTSSFSIGAALSYFITGHTNDIWGRQVAFIVCAIGPAIAFVLALFVFDSKYKHEHKPTTALLDFRPVLANRQALGFTLAYCAHNAELFAFRSWMIAFLVFSQSLQGTNATWWNPALIATAVVLLGMPSSIVFNEIAMKIGRQRIVIGVMTCSAIIGVIFGFSSALSMPALVLLAFVYGITITGDSSAITAGVVQAAQPMYMGATMAVHSVIGFIGGFLGPVIFGVMLEFSGGSESHHAWGIAFTTISLLLLLGPVAVIRLTGTRNMLY